VHQTAGLSLGLYPSCHTLVVLPFNAPNPRSTPKFALFASRSVSTGRPLPFAARNSRSTLKIHHSLTFALLLKNTDATVPHGCPCPGPNLETPSSSAHSSAPPFPTTHYPPPTTHSLLFAPLFSYSLAPIREGYKSLLPPTRPHRFLFSLLSCTYKSLFPQPLCFHIDLRCPGVSPKLLCACPSVRRVSVANPFFSSICRLFALYLHLSPFVFINLEPLFPKHPGGGMVHACVGADCIAD
jgi:hypothetical protein